MDIFKIKTNLVRTPIVVQVQRNKKVRKRCDAIPRVFPPHPPAHACPVRSTANFCWCVRRNFRFYTQRILHPVTEDNCTKFDANNFALFDFFLRVRMRRIHGNATHNS